MLSPAAAPVSSHTTNNQFIVGNQFVAAASPFLFCMPRAGVFQHGAGVIRPLCGLVWTRIDTSADVPMALPSWAVVRSWGTRGAPSAERHLFFHGCCPCCRSVTLPALAFCQAFCPVLTLQREKTRFLITGWLFRGSGGCRRWAGSPRHAGRNNGATVQPNTPAPVSKVQRGVFSTFLFPCLGIITWGNKEPFRPARSPQPSPGGCVCTHTCQLSAGFEETVTLGSGVGTTPVYVPRSPGSHGWGGGFLSWSSWLCTPGQTAKSESPRASKH